MQSKIKIRKKYVPKGLTVLYDDRDIIVIDKSPGLLSMETASEKERTAHNLLSKYVKKGNPKSKINLFVVHRLDQKTSGVMIFAKSLEVKENFEKQWKNVEKKYIALVAGHFKEKNAVFESYLADGDDYKVRSVSNPKKGKFAKTKYKVIKEFKKCSLLEIDLITGKKNQIRVHMSENGHPIIGDVKYGSKIKGRLALHALSIKFKHPFSNEEMLFTTEQPDFLQLIK
jgi:tRNA pseudouridine32 synthase/23S rRNA pseudouridine746 synthase/23S rRNA pseudouridine1911/1915/1917 synthase